MADTQREFTREELRGYNGQDGKPVYVAYEGRVYDLSESKMWRTGTHMRKHAAGTDLTGEIENAPHETDMLERFPQIGVLTTSIDPAGTAPDYSHLPAMVGRFLKRFPFFERHPHPMTVHFPIALNILAPVFLALYLLFGIRAFEVTAFHILGGALLFSLVTLPTGFLTWWINYLARPVKAVIWKIGLSSVLFVIGTIAFVMRWRRPGIVDDLGGAGLLYLILVGALFPVVGAIGWLGAGLTFPMPKRHKKPPEVSSTEADH